LLWTYEGDIGVGIVLPGILRDIFPRNIQSKQSTFYFGVCNSATCFIQVQISNRVCNAMITHDFHFRRWFVGQGRSLFKDQGRSTIPMDRFAGHGAWSNPTDMPGYYEKEQSLVRSKFGPKVTDLNTEIASIDKDLKNSSLSTTWPELKKRKVEDMTQLKKIFSEWFSTDVQVNSKQPVCLLSG
jgi:hypothetical protein